MSRSYHEGSRRLHIRAVRRGKPDLRKLARAMIELAAVEAEAQAQREHEQRAEVAGLPKSDQDDPGKDAA